jgi:hypothetical protein
MIQGRDAWIAPLARRRPRGPAPAGSSTYFEPGTQYISPPPAQ